MKIRLNREEKILIAGSFLAFNSFIVGFFSSNGSEISNMFLRTYNAFVFYGVIWVITRFLKNNEVVLYILTAVLTTVVLFSFLTILVLSIVLFFFPFNYFYGKLISRIRWFEGKNAEVLVIASIIFYPVFAAPFSILYYILGVILFGFAQ